MSEHDHLITIAKQSRENAHAPSVHRGRIEGRSPDRSEGHRLVGGQRFCRADYHRRERQRQLKNDETRPSPEAACEEFFPGE